jgi:phosphorylcholine metabolism protein LicD
VLVTLYFSYRYFSSEKNYNEMQKIPPIQRKEEMLKQLYLVSTYFKRNNIPVWIAYGTLLGKIRENNIICYDDDVDMEILHSDKHRALETLHQICEDYPEYEITFPFTFNNNIIGYLGGCRLIKLRNKENNIDLDIFPLKITKENKITNYCSNTNEHLRNIIRKTPCRNIHHEYSAFFPLRQSELCGIPVFLPNNPQYLLEYHYGENYMTPNMACDSNCMICEPI